MEFWSPQAPRTSWTPTDVVSAIVSCPHTIKLLPAGAKASLRFGRSTHRHRSCIFEGGTIWTSSDAGGLFGRSEVLSGRISCLPVHEPDHWQSFPDYKQQRRWDCPSGCRDSTWISSPQIPWSFSTWNFTRRDVSSRWIVGPMLQKLTMLEVNGKKVFASDFKHRWPFPVTAETLRSCSLTWAVKPHVPS